MNTITFRLLALPLVVALASSACVASSETDAREGPVGAASGAWAGFRWSYGPPGLGFPLWCDDTGACFSPFEGDFPWL
jgi:hypothetical protein